MHRQLDQAANQITDRKNIWRKYSLSRPLDLFSLPLLSAPGSSWMTLHLRPEKIPRNCQREGAHALTTLMLGMISDGSWEGREEEVLLQLTDAYASSTNRCSRVTWDFFLDHFLICHYKGVTHFDSWSVKQRLIPIERCYVVCHLGCKPFEPWSYIPYIFISFSLQLWVNLKIGYNACSKY